MKKDEFVDLMRQQGWTAEEVKEMVEVPLCGCPDFVTQKTRIL